MSKNPNYTNKTKNTATNFDLITEFLLSKQKKQKKKKKSKYFNAFKNRNFLRLKWTQAMEIKQQNQTLFHGTHLNLQSDAIFLFTKNY